MHCLLDDREGAGGVQAFVGERRGWRDYAMLKHAWDGYLLAYVL